MSKYIKSQVFQIFAVIAILLFGVFNSNVFAHGGDNDNDKCGTYTYYFERDDNNGKVDVDFENDRKQIDVKGVNGWSVTRVELDVNDDNHSGFWKYSDGNLNNFNPHPGGKIEKARVTVTKVCFTPSPRPTSTPCPSNPPTPTFSSSPTPFVTQSPIPTPTPFLTSTPEPTGDPCEGNCNQESTPTAVPTIYDVCANIDGIQTSVPDGKHLDSGNINCVEFSPSGPSESNNATKIEASVQVPQVLGVSTMAATGTFEDSLFYSIFAFGSSLLSIGIIKNGKKKSS